jgi:hypothetical protein
MLSSFQKILMLNYMSLLVVLHGYGKLYLTLRILGPERLEILEEIR